MSSTPSAGPPAPEATAFPLAGSADPAVLLQGQRAAECQLAEALARFQAEVTPAAEMSLPAVVEAARAAFRLGFAYTSCRGLDDDGQPLLEVTLMHRGGDQLSSQVRLNTGEAEQEFTEAARLLAQLLGIPVLSARQQAQPSKAEESGIPAPIQPAAGITAVTPVTEPPSNEPELAIAGAATTASPALAPEIPDASPPAEPTPAPAVPVDPIGPGSPDAPGTEEALRPLGDEDRATLLEIIRSLRPVEARRQFQIVFRDHFNVPRQARSIAGFITQQRHKDFIDRFEREISDRPSSVAIPAEDKR